MKLNIFLFIAQMFQTLKIKKKKEKKDANQTQKQQQG
jgi:hypothetical protein